jgi:hypothetical protein
MTRAPEAIVRLSPTPTGKKIPEARVPTQGNQGFFCDFRVTPAARKTLLVLLWTGAGNFWVSRANVLK